MKKFLVSLIGAACFTVIVASCNKKEGVEVAPTQEKEPTSVIDLMEKEEGVKYFKKDVWLKDETGKDQVLMRFAALDEDALDYYLGVRQYTVTFKTETSSDRSVETSRIDLTNTKTHGTDLQMKVGAMRVITEVLSTRFDHSAVRYAIKVSTRNAINARSAVAYSFYETQTCPTNWPETLTMEVFGDHTNCSPRLTWGVDIRINWTASWQSLGGKPWDRYLLVGTPPFSWLPCGNNNRSTAKGVMGIDGPWRVRFNAQWTDSYSFEWFNDNP